MTFCKGQVVYILREDFPEKTTGIIIDKLDNMNYTVKINNYFEWEEQFSIEHLEAYKKRKLK